MRQGPVRWLLRLAAALAALWLQTARAADVLTLGILPYLPAVELTERFTPLAERLGRELGRPVRLVVPPDYGSLVTMAGRDEIDLAYIGPAPYVTVVERFGPKTLLGRLEIAGSPNLRGAIIVRADSPLTRLQDLAGKRFAFGDPNSTMSHLVPRHLLQVSGVPLGRLAGHEFLGSHKNVALAVLMGEFDAGAVKEEILLQYPGLRALAHTRPVTQQFFIATRRMPADLAARARAVLLALDNPADVAAVLGPIEPNVSGIGTASESDYEELHRILRDIDWQGG